MTRVKICGITNLGDAQCAASAGADLLGYIFYPHSARYISPVEAGEITRAIQAEFGPEGPRMVGVFVDAPETEITETAEIAGLDLVQLHGAEPHRVVQALGGRAKNLHAFKAIRSRTLDEARIALDQVLTPLDGSDDDTVPSLLIDAYHPRQHGGTGLRADTATSQWLSQRCRLLLAGGLTAENVSDAIALIKPWGVDVSSGVEIVKGIKNHTSVRAFIAAVHATDQAMVTLSNGATYDSHG